MKDIDFDELDRAVNSLINPDVTKSVPAEITPSAPAVSAPVPSIPPATPPLAERRSSGRFMDVVHPSSDMRSTVLPRPAQTGFVNVAISPESEVKPAPIVSDPIDTDVSAEVVTESMNQPPEKVEKDGSEPLESPFLADAKVEKRPLGAFSNEVHESGPSTSITTPAATEPDLESLSLDSPLEATSKPVDKPIENDTPLPAELQTDLLSIEANEDSTITKVEETSPTVQTAAVGPTSITPQYTQQPSTGDKPAGNIFDTQAYKKPQATKGKKSGLFVILWIFILLVVGAGIGAAVYFFVLPRL